MAEQPGSALGTMTYPGLSEEKLKDMIEDGFDETQIKKQNERAIRLHDENLKRLTTEMMQETHSQGELRLVLLGKTGTGKSSTGNLIMGKSGAYRESPGSTSETSVIQLEAANVDGIPVRLIDTPGFSDTSKDTNHILTEVSKILEIFTNGVHGFLFVYSLGNPRFTKEERTAFEALEMFYQGDSFYDHCFVILTYGEQLYTGNKDTHTSLVKKLDQERANDFGKLLIEKMKMKVIAVNNREESFYFKEQLRKQVVRLVAANVTKPYTNISFEQFQKNKEEITAKVAQPVRPLVPDIEEEASKVMQGMSHEQIIRQVPEIYKKVFEKISTAPGAKGVSSDQLIMAISTVVEGKKERLTDKSFLEKIADFAINLVKAAGSKIKAFFGKLFS